MTVFAPGSSRAGSRRRSGDFAIHAISPWKPTSSQGPRASPCGTAPARAKPTRSKPSSRALFLMELALLIVVVRETPGGAQVVALVGGIRRGAPVGRDAAVAHRPLARDQPDDQVHQRCHPQDRDGKIDVPHPEEGGSDDRRDDDAEA